MDAIELLKSVIAKTPEQAELWYLLGSEYALAGQKSEARKAYSEALKYCDDDEICAKIAANLAALASARIPDQEKTPEDKSQDRQEPADRMPGAQASEETQEPETGFGEDGFNEDSPIDESENGQAEDESENGRAEEDSESYGLADEPESGWAEDKSEDGRAEEEAEDEAQPASVFRVLKGGGAADEVRPEDEITFEDVGGLAEIKKMIRMKIIEPFINPGLFRKFKKKSGGGILMYGPPGCGKTYLAKAAAGECRAYFRAAHISDILSPYIGQSEQNIRDIFDAARAHKPCVLFFDEIDSIGFNRAKLSSEHFRPVIDQFLTEIEGIDSGTEKLLIIGATNMPWDVDAAFKRPGRFDKMVFIPPPDKEARAVIFALKLEGRPVEALDYQDLANRTEMYSGADIENVVEVASENVITEIMNTGRQRNIQMGDLLRAVEATRPSTLEWLKTIQNYVKYANQTGLYDDIDQYIKKHKKFL